MSSLEWAWHTSKPPPVWLLDLRNALEFSFVYTLALFNLERASPNFSHAYSWGLLMFDLCLASAA